MLKGVLKSVLKCLGRRDWVKLGMLKLLFGERPCAGDDDGEMAPRFGEHKTSVYTQASIELLGQSLLGSTADLVGHLAPQVVMLGLLDYLY